MRISPGSACRVSICPTRNGSNWQLICWQRARTRGEAMTARNPEAVARGKMLVQTAGCLNCHSLPLENQFKAMALVAISDWKAGCLAEAPSLESKAPRFHFTTAERAALRLFGASDHASLSRHVPVEFADRQSRQLNCAECHGKIEGIPAFEFWAENSNRNGPLNFSPEKFPRNLARGWKRKCRLSRSGHRFWQKACRCSTGILRTVRRKKRSIQQPRKWEEIWFPFRPLDFPVCRVIPSELWLRPRCLKRRGSI